MNQFIFDVDGTLTESRSNIDGMFQSYFLDFCFANEVYLVTGSDYSKTAEQLGLKICETVRRVYNCSGNDIWESGINTHTNEWHLPDTAETFLIEYLKTSNFKVRTGTHFEHRPGMCNFSIVGRGANKLQRSEYVKWDNSSDERVNIAKDFNSLFPELEAKVGGETGIDIFPKGLDKSQILKDFEDISNIYFFGDRCDINGNDYPIAKVVTNTFYVKSWRETFKTLRELQSKGIAL